MFPSINDITAVTKTAQIEKVLDSKNFIDAVRTFRNSILYIDM